MKWIPTPKEHGIYVMADWDNDDECETRAIHYRLIKVVITEGGPREFERGEIVGSLPERKHSTVVYFGPIEPPPKEANS